MKKRRYALILALVLALSLPGTVLAAGEDEPGAPGETVGVTAPEEPEKSPAPEQPEEPESPAVPEAPGTPEPTPESPPETSPEPEEMPAVGETVRRYYVPDIRDMPPIFIAAPESAPLFEAGQRELRRLSLRINAIRAAAGEDGSLYVSYSESVWPVLARAAAVTASLCGYETVPENWTLSAGELRTLEAVCREAFTLSPVVGETVFVPDGGEPPAEGTGTEKTLQIHVAGTPLSELAAAFGTDIPPLPDTLESALSTAPLEAAVPAALPEGLHPLRRAVVEKACSLVGRVPYRWGGKSTALGWDTRWGVPALVLSGGHVTSDTAQPGGLDCSGFVNWAFVNAVGTADAVETLGGGTFGLWNHTVPLAWADVQPGDLLWYGDESCSVAHVGIAVGRNETGELLVCHASGGADNIVIETASEGGFTFASTPAEFYERFGAL